MDDAALQAQILRRSAQGGALQDADQQANSLNLLAAIAQMANNPGGAAAAKLAQQEQVKRFSPRALGTQGFMLPQSGNFVESPMYVDEKNATRDARQDVLRQTLAAKQEQEAARREAQVERDAAREESRAADRQLRLTLGQGSLDLRREGMMLRQSMAGAGAQEKKDAKATADVEKGVTKFSGVLEKAGVPEFETALGTVESTLAKYASGKLPGFGRMLSFIPDAMVDDETQMVRSNMQGAANILLKARSGSAVTEPEQIRFLREVAQGKGMSEAAMRNGWANIRKTFESKKDNLLSGVSDDVLTEYNSRTPSPMVRRASATPAAKAGPTPPPGLVLPPGAKYVGPAP